MKMNIRDNIYYKVDKCPKCNSTTVSTWKPSLFSTRCLKCDYKFATSVFHPIDMDETIYNVKLTNNINVSKDILKVISKLTGENFIKCSELIKNNESILFGKANELNDKIDYLISNNINLEIIPKWKYFSDPVEIEEYKDYSIEKIKFRFFIDFLVFESPLWSKNDIAYDNFGVLVNLDDLSLKEDTKNELKELCEDYQDAYEWEYPYNKIIWPMDKIREFNSRAEMLLNKTVNELGPEFELEYLLNDIKID